MAESELELARRIYALWEKGNFSESDWAEPDLEFMPPIGEEVRGIDAMGRSWGGFLETWEGFEARPVEYVEAADGVLVITQFHGHSIAADIPAEDLPGAAVLRIRDGKVWRLELYFDIERAREAAGLKA